MGAQLRISRENYPKTEAPTKSNLKSVQQKTHAQKVENAERQGPVLVF